MPRLVCAVAFASLTLLGCDDKKEPDLGIQKSKSIYDVKQSTKTEMTKEELQEARRKAGFKSDEETKAEAKAQYLKMEQAYVKGRLDGYRTMLKKLRGKLDEVEKAAPKWAKSEAAFTKFNEKYGAANKEFKKAYDDLTRKGTQGVILKNNVSKLIGDWENFNGDLGPKISEAEGFGPTLEALRKAIGDVEKELEEIEKDESIEANGPAGDEEPAGKKKKKK